VTGLQQRPITGNGNVATKTGNIYISVTVTMTDKIEIPNVKSGNCDNNRKPKWQYRRFGCQSCHLTVRRIVAITFYFQRLSWSKIPNLSLEFRRYLSQFQRYKYFWFQRPFPVVGHYWNHPGTLFSSSPWSKTLRLSSEF